MSSMSGEYRCTECGSENCHNEEFNDDESGHIISCNDCGYCDVYREDSVSGKVIEEYQGYEYQTNVSAYSVIPTIPHFAEYN